MHGRFVSWGSDQFFLTARGVCEFASCCGQCAAVRPGRFWRVRRAERGRDDKGSGDVGVSCPAFSVQGILRLFRAAACPFGTH